LATQISQTNEDSLKVSTEQNIENGLSIVNITDCINILKSYYNIPKEKNLLIVKTDTMRLFNTTDKLSNIWVSFNIYNPDNMSVLNKSICNDFQIKTPLNDNQINKTLLYELKNKSIDIYNPNDKFFNSRCYSNIDPVTQYSTTLNFRIKSYFRQKTILCDNGCEYISIDENDYVTCTCSDQSKVNTEFSYNIIEFIKKGYSNINIDLFLCYQQAFSVFKI
jgi:hypothetical protein